MEDRQPAGLYLEMLDGDVDAARDRADVLAKSLKHVTVFANCSRDRTDLPRTLPECDHLLVGELDAAEAVDGPGMSFRRYPRPSQGTLGLRTTGLQLVLVSPKQPEDAQALRDWADHIHLRHIAGARVPGFTMITPYENVLGDTPRFLHFYEMDDADPEASFQRMVPSVIDHLGGGPGTPAFDDWAWHPALWINYVNTFRRVDGIPDGT